MSVEEAERLLDAFFGVVGHVKTLHLTGGGEPFLHAKLPELVETAMKYESRFDRLMLFTNSTVPPSEKLLNAISRHRDKIFVQASLYNQKPDIESAVIKSLDCADVDYRVEKYYGENQSFDGWVDFGEWGPRGRTPEENRQVFRDCAVTRDMCGNWRTRDGKVHWCARSQRGMELGLMPDCPNDYVDLYDNAQTLMEKREKFRKIGASCGLLACDYCSGEQGTKDMTKRFQAAEQIR
jgi:hypothetical protein